MKFVLLYLLNRVWLYWAFSNISNPLILCEKAFLLYSRPQFIKLDVLQMEWMVHEVVFLLIL